MHLIMQSSVVADTVKIQLTGLLPNIFSNYIYRIYLDPTLIITSTERNAAVAPLTNSDG